MIHNEANINIHAETIGTKRIPVNIIIIKPMLKDTYNGCFGNL